jgi:uncharacterized protein (DUF2267 family)
MGGTTPGRINTEQRAKADRIRDRLAKEIGDIQAQKNLTTEGKQARLAKAVLKAQADLTQLRTAEAEDVTNRRDQIIQGLFGHTRPDDTRIISVRDAADRAARIKTPDECAALMNRAALHNDEVLLRALARECAERRSPVAPAYSTLFEQWADQQTGGPEALEELATISDETSDAGHRLNRERAFSVGMLPDEIRGIGDLKALAAQADTIADPDEPGGTASAASSAFDSRFR